MRNDTTTKVMLVGVETADEIAIPDERGAVHAARQIDASTFTRVALSLLAREASMRWWNERVPAVRLASVLAARVHDAGDVAGLHDAVQGWNDFQWSACVVAEAVPRWDRPIQPDRQRPQPGIVLTSLLHRAAHLTPEAFVDHWREVHQPMSLRIHPQWTYVRNVVDRRLSGSVDFDAVCEEGLADADDVLDPSRFFGADGGDWKQNSREIRDDIPLFLDPIKTTSSLMREYRLE